MNVLVRELGLAAAGLRAVASFQLADRPGLQYLVSTGHQHGFESLEEQRSWRWTSPAGPADVVPQPFRLRAETASGWREHVPDFLAVTVGGVLLADVRPRPLIRDSDLVLFAAAAEAALAAGWRYAVFAGGGLT